MSDQSQDPDNYQNQPAPRAQPVSGTDASAGGDPEQQRTNRAPQTPEQQQDYYLKQEESLYERTKAHMDEWENHRKSAMQYLHALQEQNENEQQFADKAYSGLLDQQQQPMQGAGINPMMQQPQQQQGFMQNLSKYLMFAIPMAVIFGSRGRAGGWAALGAFGAGLKAFQQGQQAQAARQFQYWRQYSAQQNQQQRERMGIYKEILANRRFNLEQQQKLIAMSAREFGDDKLAKDAEAGADHILKNLQHKEQVHGQEERWRQKVGKSVLQQAGDTPEGKQYALTVRGQFTEEDNKTPLDPFKSDKNFERANRLLDYPSFVERYKRIGKDEDAHLGPSAKDKDPEGLFGEGGTPGPNARKRIDEIAGGGAQPTPTPSPAPSATPQMDIAGAAPIEDETGGEPVEDDGRPPAGDQEYR